MLAKLFISFAGFTLSCLPYQTLETFAYFLAKIYLFFPQKRKRLLYSNLTHAFPEWSKNEIKRTAIKSTVCLFEMGFFSLIYPHLSRYERRATIGYSSKIESELIKIRLNNRPTLILLPHISLFEAIATSQVFRPYGGKTLGAIYRPNSNQALDDWINKSRTDLGLKTFSRRKGLLQARKHLANGNWLALLFDQNAGLGGELSLFMDRVCSMTPLPDIVLRGIDANIVLATPVRQSFFRAKLELYNLGTFQSGNISQIAHDKLESIIRKHPEGFPEWLWSHGKWKTQDHPNQIFQLHSKRMTLPKKESIPKKMKLWIRMPNWLGDIVMTIPLIKAIEKSRPDTEISLLCQVQYKSFLEYLGVGNRVIALPEKGFLYFFNVWNFRKQFPDVHFLFTNSLRGDIEAFLCGAKLRLGGSTGRKRLLLSNQAIVHKDFDKKHQTLLWEEYLKHFGLKEPIDFSPIPLTGTKPIMSDNIICIAPGSSNTPEKRWPIENWVGLISVLIKELPSFQIKLIGTSKDSSICQQVAKPFNAKLIENLAGKTDLVGLCDILVCSKILICNDSGAMHIANALGLTVIAIFGTTNPDVTGPSFKSKTVLVKRNEQLSDEEIQKQIANCIKAVMGDQEVNP